MKKLVSLCTVAAALLGLTINAGAETNANAPPNAIKDVANQAIVDDTGTNINAPPNAAVATEAVNTNPGALNGAAIADTANANVPNLATANNDAGTATVNTPTPATTKAKTARVAHGAATVRWIAAPNVKINRYTIV